MMESHTSSKEAFRKLHKGVSQILERVRYRYEVINFPVKYRERSIDIIARSEEYGSLIIRLKTSTQVNRGEAQDLVKSSLALDALPLVVSDISEVYDNVVIEREGVYVVNLKTLQNMYLGREELVTLYRKGELFVKVNREGLVGRRTALGYTLTSLSRLLNVSRKTLELYERRGGNVTIETAEKLTKRLGEDVIQPITLKDLHDDFVGKAAKETSHGEVTALKVDLKYLFNVEEGDIYLIRKSAPDYIIRDDETLITIDATNPRRYGMKEMLIKTHECVKFSNVAGAELKIVTDDSNKAKAIADELSSLRRGNVEVIKV